MWAHPKRGNLRMNDVIIEWKILSQSIESRSSTKPDMSQGSQTTGEPMQLLSGIQETGNVQWRQDEIVKQSDQYGEGREQEWNGSVLWSMMWKILDGMTKKGIKIFNELILNSRKVEIRVRESVLY